MNDGLNALYEPEIKGRAQISAWLVLYTRGTGRITSVLLQCPDSVGPLVNAQTGSCEIPGAGLRSPMEGFAYMATHYVDDRGFCPQIRDKEPCPASLEGHTLRNLPLPCTIEISAPLDRLITHEVFEDSDLDLSFEHPGTYTVRVTSSRHLPGEFAVTQEG